MFGQDRENVAARTARNIRVRKLALNLRGEVVTLVSVDGSKVTGRLLDADFERFLLEKGDKRTEVALDEVTAVILSPGFMEIVLSCVAGVFGGGFGSAVIVLSTPDAKSGVKIGAGVAGAALGGWLGYKTFYQEEIIELD